MRVLYLVLISQVSAQLQCDKSIIRATVGRRFNVACTYNTNQFRFSKKYWCLGESRSSCEIVMDTDGFTKAELKNRAQIIDAVYRGLHILMTGLQLRDSGVYWAGIDKIYADIMFKIQVEVTEEAVIRPKVWPVGSPLLTCVGQPLTLRCRSERGTNVQYSWYRKADPEAVLLQTTSDLPLHCASLTQDGHFVCSAHNAVSREHSNAVFIHVLQPGHKDCVYLLTSEGFESYDCKTTTTPRITTTMTTVEVFSSTLATQSSGYENHSLCVNQTWMEGIFFRSWSGVPLWYDILRWTLFTIMMVTTGLVHMCTPARASGHRLTHKHQKHI
ncbi:uncharacterized protein LOC118822352 [Colossoma macropomum]|uniref:uncharacterized protein LOC118822352 n=1 Tax=Colossoma macropomum TaxID=42526 RepID=UPI0018652C0A|nr:uncharacterized protein LOC118822352 [Colossoma macropomum]